MLPSKQILVAVIWEVTTFITIISGIANARSVYVISDTGTYEYSVPVIQAYEIQGNGLIYQKDYNSVYPCAISIAIDIESAFLFITHEYASGQNPGNRIEIISAKTMSYVDTVLAPGASDLAGIVFDSTKQKVYTVDRKTSNLYVYSWDPRIPRLSLDQQVELEGLVYGDVGGAWGIALDEENKRLWVTSNETKVRFYDTNDWSHDLNTDFITLSQRAVGIAVDVENQYVYTGRSQAYPSGGLRNYLSQYDLSAEPNTAETLVDVGTEVIGIAVDQETSLVYITTYGDSGDTYYSNPPKDRLMVYDSNLEKQSWESGDIGNPAGVAVAGDVSYKEPFPTLALVKEDNVADCVAPYDSITYTITYYANSDSDSNVVITDYLPIEVDPNNPFDPNYDYYLHRYSWQIGTLSPGDSNSVTLEVVVNELAEPLGGITNYCDIEGDQYCSFTTIDTNVCCLGGDTIYVDKSATWGFNTGTSWQNAYTDLQDGFARAHNGCGNQIWVAKGTYKPTIDTDDYFATFQLVDGVAMYGGFVGNETSHNQRDWITNETILTGDINADGTSDVREVVTAANVDATTIIDGFVIRKGDWAGFWCDTNGLPTISNTRIKENNYDGVDCNGNSNPIIINCTIEDNGYYGILCLANSSATITQSVIQNNGTSYDYYYGIYCQSNSDINVFDCIIANNKDDGIYGDGANLMVSKCIIKDNIGDGIHCINLENDSVININNNLICNNEGNGIYLFGTDYVFLPNFMINNSTIAYNTGYGFTCSGDPSIISCILCNNDVNNFDYYEPYEYQYVRYCCVCDTPVYPGVGNKNNDPCFFDADANNFHLDVNSFCIDAGDPDFNPNPPETDIDGEPRMVNGRVDMGADEYYWSTVDFDKDEFVNFIDYAMLANAWQSSSGQPDYNDIFDLEDNNTIDYDDLALFCDDWLWVASWNQTMEAMMMGMGMGQSVSFTEGVYTSPPVEQKQPEQITQLDIEELLNWLAEVWLDPEVQEQISEAEWLKFIESLKSDLE